MLFLSLTTIFIYLFLIKHELKSIFILYIIDFVNEVFFLILLQLLIFHSKTLKITLQYIKAIILIVNIFQLIYTNLISILREIYFISWSKYWVILSQLILIIIQNFILFYNSKHFRDTQLLYKKDINTKSVNKFIT